MKCIIPGVNIKVFGRAIHSLSKIGDELYVEPLEEGFALRTVNSTRSAYAYMLFAPSFFTHYNDGSALVKSTDDNEEGLRFKVNMKSILTVFRSLGSLEKSVERCQITLNSDAARLVFQLYCRHGIVKTHNLAFIECETLQAVFSKDLTPNKLTAHPKLLCDAVVNFQNNQEEVTLIAKPDKISLKNYVDDEPDPKKVVLTEMHLDPNEFDNCQLGVDTEITFCLKELRAILGFADVISLPINIHFEKAGKPVVISIDSDKTFEANFVLATLAETDSQVPHTQSVSQPTAYRNKPKPHSRQNKSSSNSRYTSNNQQTESNAGTSVRSNGFTNTSTSNDKRHAESSAQDDEFEDDFDEMIVNDPTVDNLSRLATEQIQNNKNNESVNPVPSKVVQKEGVRKSMSPVPSTSDCSESPLIPIQCETYKPSAPHEKLSISEMQALDEEEDDDDDDIIPGTPPSKKFRSIIFGSSQTAQTKENSAPAMILAENTDDEDD